MDIEIKDFEKQKIVIQSEKKKTMTDSEINEKYAIGEQRIVTEVSSFKLDLIKSVFSKPEYELKPEFQRRITWDDKKRSKLIESFIMNIPVPPVFLYEDEYSSYVVMDGLQRISTIIEFYSDHFSLTGLDEWSELNGKKYSQLPQKVKEGIDRRQLSVITMLKESAKDAITADKMKKMVFERLNTGGVQLSDQEIRNALFSGKFNDLCLKLSDNPTFRKLWGISDINEKNTSDDRETSYDDLLVASRNKMYRRMYDVELILRYFSMRNIENYSGKLSKFLDAYLQKGNSFTDEEIKALEREFIDSVAFLDKLFGDKAFCISRNENSWSTPQNMIYDVMMLSVANKKVRTKELKSSVEERVKKLSEFYVNNSKVFNGKKQSKSDITQRVDLVQEFLLKEC